MSQNLINLNSDLKKLRETGYSVQIKEQFLLVSNVPYVNSSKEIRYGEFISELTLAGNNTSQPSTHTIFFIGEYPCDNQGSPIKAIEHAEHLSKEQKVAGKQIHYTFSNKPKDGYKDYFEKVETYIKIISHPARSIDPSVTAKIYATIKPQNDDCVFHYLDTNSSKSGISELSKKFKNQKIAIIGLGGTGSYVLDLISKTPVEEIHLFDKDDFLSHNAFRAPGAISLEQLNKKQKKVSYFKEKYSKMRKNIYDHYYNIEESTLKDLSDMNFVFICIDKGSVKKLLFDFLIEKQIPFIDVGIGVLKENEKILGQIRMNLCTPDRTSHLEKYISFTEDPNDEYSTNIQIADLNSLNATLAVIKWKKYLGFYEDSSMEYTNLYTIRTNSLVSKKE